MSNELGHAKHKKVFQRKYLDSDANNISQSKLRTQLFLDPSTPFSDARLNTPGAEHPRRARTTQEPNTCDHPTMPAQQPSRASRLYPAMTPLMTLMPWKRRCCSASTRSTSTAARRPLCGCSCGCGMRHRTGRSRQTGRISTSSLPTATSVSPWRRPHPSHRVPPADHGLPRPAVPRGAWFVPATMTPII